jgi:hypothetical protein
MGNEAYVICCLKELEKYEAQNEVFELQANFRESFLEQYDSDITEEEFFYDTRREETDAEVIISGIVKASN